MLFTKEQMLLYLQKHHVAYQLYEHTPLFTVEQGLAIIAELQIPGTIIKNLFLKDDRQKLCLISAIFPTKIVLKEVGKILGMKNVRFADAHLLMQHLGVQPGSVTPLAIIHDTTKAVEIVLDAKIFEQEYIQIHPLQNDATIVIQPDALINFFQSIHRSYRVYDFAENEIV